MSAYDPQDRLIVVLLERRTFLIEEYIRRTQARIPAYGAMRTADLVAPFTKAVDWSITSLGERDVSVLVDYLEMITHQRLQTGFPIEAMLGASHVLGDLLEEVAARGLADDPAALKSAVRRIGAVNRTVAHVMSRVHLVEVINQGTDSAAL
jgi:hypothetical protein